MPGHLLRWEFGHSQNKNSAVNNLPLTTPQRRARDDRRSSVDTINKPRANMEHLSNIIKKHGADKKENRREGSSSRPSTPKSVKMDIQMESPPVLFLGPPSNSSAGFLMSAQLKVDVMRDPVTLNGLEVELRGTTTHKKPVSDKCPDCAATNSTLHTWKLLVEPRTLHSGERSLPFSMVLPDHLPATTRGFLATLTYNLIARATLSSGEILTHTHELDVKRALAPRRDPKQFKRIFPPTKLIAEAFFQPIIHPIGDFTVLFRLSGLVTPNRDGSASRNRLRRILWRIEQHERDIAPACARHADKVGGPGKGKTHEQMRVIGSDEIKEGWKTDYGAEMPNPNPNPQGSSSSSDNDPLIGAAEIEFPARIHTNLRPLCDMENNVPAGLGLRISHTMVIEIVIEDEWAPPTTARRPSSIAGTPTGAARVLKMTFGVQVTERAGLGITWDEEQPPVYEDVPPSPPHYAGIEAYEGPPLDERFERISLGPPREGDAAAGSSSSSAQPSPGLGPAEL